MLFVGFNLFMFCLVLIGSFSSCVYKGNFIVGESNDCIFNSFFVVYMSCGIGDVNGLCLSWSGSRYLCF